jgi:glycosyltransferase involved in cell wall biosynthesis
MRKVSTIIPTYNRRTQVLRAIDSVLAQTTPVDEIIVVDDGSTDGSTEAIRSRYGSRVTLFRQENAGVAAARNRGMCEARGEWIAFLDSDDVWFPTKLENQLEAIRVLGNEFGACFTDCVFTGDTKSRRSLFSEAGLKCCSEFSELHDPRRYLPGGSSIMYLPSLLVLRSLVKKLNGFDEAMLISEDLDLFFRLTFETKFCLVSVPLVNVDRTPSRSVGLTELYTLRDDRKYENIKWMYTKWLALPEVAGTTYERRVRELLRDIFYQSAECKIHRLRIGLALREIGRLRGMGDSYPVIVATMLSRKIAKLRRRFRSPDRNGEPMSIGPGPNLA